MSERPWYKRYGADFVHGSLGLTLEEKGAYSLCLDLIYDHGGPIPDDPKWIAGVCGCSVRKWNSVRARLISAGKLFEIDGFLMNFRAVFELEKSSKTPRKSVENVSKSARKVAEKQSSSNKNKGMTLKKAALHARVFQSPESRIEKKGVSLETPKESSPEFNLTPPDSLDRTAWKAWWKLYPRKKAVRNAEVAYYGVIRRKDATPEELLAGLQASIAYWRTEVKSSEFIPHAATWLNAGSWADDNTTIKRTSDYELMKARALNGGSDGDDRTSETDTGEPAQLGPPDVPTFG